MQTCVGSFKAVSDCLSVGGGEERKRCCSAYCPFIRRHQAITEIQLCGAPRVGVNSGDGG